MINSLYAIRNYCSADFNRFVQFVFEAEKVEPTGHHISPKVIEENLNRPYYSPEQDFFLVEVSGSIVGYLDITPEVKIERVILNCLVHPGHRRNGIATKLVAHAMQRAKELGARVAHINTPQDNEIAIKSLGRLGFVLVRRFPQYRLDISDVPEFTTKQASFQYRPIQQGEEEKLTQIQNSSFIGSWGYSPNTVRQIAYQTSLSDFSPESVILACDGDKVIGYCWTKTSRNLDTGKTKGQIYMLGVDPEYRGRGAGKGILLAGLSHLKSRNVQIIELGVDSQNESAINLYESIGFMPHTSSLCYEKETG